MAVLTTLIALPVLISLLLLIPSLQNYVAQSIAKSLSNKYQTEITVKRFYLTPFSKIICNELTIYDQKSDTLFYVDRFESSIDLLSLRSKQIELNQVAIESPIINIDRENNQYNFYFLLSKNTSNNSKWKIIPKNIQMIDGSISYKESDSTLRFPKIDISQLNLVLNNLYYNKDSLYFNLSQISLNEPNKFSVIEGNMFLSLGKHSLTVTDLNLSTPYSKINIDTLKSQFQSFDDFKKLSNDVSLQLDISPSVIHQDDISFFVNKDDYINFPITISGNFDGTISNLKGNNAKISFGSNSSISATFNVIGLPNINETFLFLKVNYLRTNTPDLSDLFAKVSHTNYAWSNETLNKLGNIEFTGNLSGFFTDLVAYGKFNTAIGTINTDLGIKIKNRITFSGNVNTAGFNIGKLINMENQVGKISMKMSINGSHKSARDFFIYLNGQIDSVNIRNYQYQNISLNGLFTNQKFDGQFYINDPYGKVHFSGNIDYSQSVPNFNFFASIQNLKLDRLNIAPTLTESSLSLNILSNFEANNISDLTGFIRVDDGIIKTKADSVNIDSLIISAQKLDENKQLVIQSNLVDGEIVGKYDFTKFSSSIKNFISKFIPGLFKNESFEKVQNNSYSFLLELKDLGELINIIYPSIKLSSNGTISGQFNADANYLEMEGEIPSFSYGTIKIDNLLFNIKGDDELTSIFQSDNLNLYNILQLNNFSIQQKIKENNFLTNVFWNSWDETTNSGSIFTSTNIMNVDTSLVANIDLLESNIILNDTVWNIKPTKFNIGPAGYSVNNFRIWHSNQQITVDGKISKSGNDGLNGFIRNIDLGRTLQNIHIDNLNIQGILNAEFQAKNLFTEPSIIGDFQINNFIFNDENIGQFYTTSEWNSDNKALIINTSISNNGIQKLLGSGLYYTKENKIDFDARVDSLEISFLNYYLKNIMQNLSGNASGNVKISGSVTNPDFTGRVNLNDAIFDVNFLKTSYHLSDSVIFEPNKMTFKNMTLTDRYGHSGKFGGTIEHHLFKNMRYDLTINANNILALNTKQKDNPLYYGSVYATGNMNITGKTNQIYIDISARTLSGTEFYIPLEETGEVSNNNFIRFSHSNNEDQLGPNKSLYQSNYEIDLSGVEMAMELEVTPDAMVQIILDPRTGDILKGRGHGDIQLKIDKYAKFLMYGNYIIDNGEYLFSLQNVINKRFFINSGGLLHWDGDPYNANIDVNATYKVRASLYDLVGSTSQDNSEEIRKRVPINCNIHLTDRLSKPTIHFDIEAPTLPQSDQTIIQSYINSEEELNRQVLSLLVLNRFYTPESQRNNDLNNTPIANSAAKTTTAEVLSSTLSNWLSQLNKDLDIGVNYRPGDEITTREVELALSTQLFNDRVTINTNLGYEEYTAQKDASNFIGDFDLNVKLNSSGTIRAHAYTRTNNDILYTTSSPTKQGIGISFRNEFNSWGELIKKYWGIITGNERKKKKAEETANNSK